MTRALRKQTLRAAFAEFVKHPTPWMLAAWVAILLTGRIAEGTWTLADAIGPVVLVGLSPISEWLIHVGILHWRPRTLGPVKIDSRLARDHRRHHRDPRDIPLVFIPWPSLAFVMAALSAIAILAFSRTGLGLTFVLTIALFLLFYEWTHFLVHTDYKPRHGLFRAVWRNHRYHHFKNENYWFTVTSSGTADRLLGTYPDPSQVRSSPTVRHLHAPTAMD